MSRFFTPARLWSIAALLVVIDLLIIYTYIHQPAVLGVQEDNWDFRMQELRYIESDMTQPTPTPSPTPDLLPTPSPSPADAHGRVL